MINVLVVEDDKNIRKLMEIWLVKAGFNVIAAENGEEAITALEKNSADIMLLDIMMPKMNGYEFLGYLRRNGIKTPAIMTTAKEAIEDKKMCFDLEADDYMVKPINREELIMRINAVLRRADVKQDNKLIFGKVTLDKDTLSIVSDCETLYLPKKEFGILFRLLSSPEKVFTKNQLMDEFWGLSTDSFTDTVKVHINRIRSKISRFAEIDVATIRGVGYKGVINEQKK